MKNTGIVIASLIGGMVVGSALAMLLTPQSGPELRKQIKDFIDKQSEKVHEKLDKVHEKVQSEIGKVASKYDNV
ncbi:YtxH domain-containing protein [Alistipes sp.]|uniref:YtxH domain-containing protein n=1 Tax=Alistipes sp. TaxID=1872444 RepID=UPI000E8D75B7|nr:YtxH domain-containing protein [Alistipes sp.]HBX90073.1 YtxH domain-containing protein [Alistipes sp.]HCN13366.1 YtxH domain-containing protein [Alistipes sp.]